MHYSINWTPTNLLKVPGTVAKWCWLNKIWTEKIISNFITLQRLSVGIMGWKVEQNYQNEQANAIVLI